MTDDPAIQAAYEAGRKFAGAAQQRAAVVASLRAHTARADLLALANMLAGRNARIGRPRMPASQRDAYTALLAEAKQRRRELVAKGTPSYDAQEAAAKWAAADARSRGHTWKTIARNMQRRAIRT